jgi:TRAP-type mannitol/chloroaromatic compound transport system permease large subunit
MGDPVCPVSSVVVRTQNPRLVAICAIMILVPIMMPIADHLGIDPIHYCLIIIVVPNLLPGHT